MMFMLFCAYMEMTLIFGIHFLSNNFSMKDLGPILQKKMMALF